MHERCSQRLGGGTPACARSWWRRAGPISMLRMCLVTQVVQTPCCPIEAPTDQRKSRSSCDDVRFCNDPGHRLHTLRACLQVPDPNRACACDATRCSCQRFGHFDVVFAMAECRVDLTSTEKAKSTGHVFLGQAHRLRTQDPHSQTSWGLSKEHQTAHKHQIQNSGPLESKA